MLLVPITFRVFIFFPLGVAISIGQSEQNVIFATQIDLVIMKAVSGIIYVRNHPRAPYMTFTELLLF